MSGVGGYTENYNSDKWYKVKSRIDVTWTYKSFNARSIKDNIAAQLFYQSLPSDTGFRVLSCTIKVSGLTDGQGIEYVSNAAQQFVIMRIENDGIYHLPSFDFGAKNAYYGFKFLKLQESCNITIEQLPLYPGFIIGDGVDDYAETERELNFEDTYTVYTAFIPFETSIVYPVLCGKDYKKDFYINYKGDNLRHASFYSANKSAYVALLNGFNILCCKRTPDKMVIKDLITGKSSEVSVDALIDNPGLYSLWRSTTIANYAKAAIAGQTICNGHFTSDEEDTKVLNWYKKEYPWLFFDQAWTVTGKTNEDTDRATIANITGNGNDLVLSNFGFAEGSGYGSYPFDMNVWIPDYIADQPYGTVHYQNNSKSYATTVKNNATYLRIKFRLRGLLKGKSFLIRTYDMNYLNTVLNTYTYTENGIYEFVYNDPNKPVRIILYNGTDKLTMSEFYLDIIPDHEGYLVTDGVDDKVYSSAFTLGKKFTVVGEWELLDKGTVPAGFIKPVDFYLYPHTNGLSFHCKRGSNATLFNNIKSLVAFNSEGVAYDHSWQKYVDTKVGDANPNHSSMTIGTGNNTFAKVAFKNMAMYAEKVLSKDDCIKAYNYLQTLKAK